jgi:hypothetical protein
MSGSGQLRYERSRLCDCSIFDVRMMRARDLIARVMRAPWSVLLLQTLAEFSSVAIQCAANFLVRARWPSPSCGTLHKRCLIPLIRADYLCWKFLMRSRPCACDVRPPRVLQPPKPPRMKQSVRRTAGHLGTTLFVRRPDRHMVRRQYAPTSRRSDAGACCSRLMSGTSVCPESD